jgi:cobalt-zinc-cadmium efflux system outer membrane protein
MRRIVLAIVVPTILVLVLPSRPLLADPPLTLDRALALARERGPTAHAARLRIEEARGQIAGARPLLGANPTISGGLGRRLGKDAATEASAFEGHVELLQPIELGGQRGARRAAASAAVAAAAASAEATILALEAKVATAFYQALAATQRGQVLEAAEAVASRSAQALERRHQLGDVPVLDVNLAKAVRARAFAQVRAAAGERLQAEADLRRLLGLAGDVPLVPAGDLRDRRRYQLEALVERAQDRADVRALIAEAEQAQAQAALGRAGRWPTLGLGAAYERDDGADVVLGLLSVELPVFARGQELDVTGKARARRLRLEADAGRSSAVMAVRTAHAIYQERLRGARALEEALPLVAENEDLARKSYEAGQLSLADWLVVRRENVETQLAFVDELLATAEAGIAVAASAGISP